MSHNMQYHNNIRYIEISYTYLEFWGLISRYRTSIPYFSIPNTTPPGVRPDSSLFILERCKFCGRRLLV